MNKTEIIDYFSDFSNRRGYYVPWIICLGGSVTEPTADEAMGVGVGFLNYSSPTAVQISGFISVGGQSPNDQRWNILAPHYIHGVITTTTDTLIVYKLPLS